MPVGGESLVSGAYTITYGGAALGLFGGDSELPMLDQRTVGEDVNNTSLYGKALLDSIYQGNLVDFQFTCLEYGKAGVLTAAFPQSAVAGRLGTIGVLQYASHAAQLVMTAVAGTPAAASPATLTAPKVCLAHGFAVRLAFGPTLRKVPIRLRAFLATLGDASTGYYSTT
jgi:hypothetical protein